MICKYIVNTRMNTAHDKASAYLVIAAPPETRVSSRGARVSARVHKIERRERTHARTRAFIR